jgi:uncharacterized membrane protein
MKIRMKKKIGFKETVFRKFLTGLATLLPTIITIFIIVKVVEFIGDNVGLHIVNFLQAVINRVGNYSKEEPFEFSYPRLVGFFLALTIIYFIGLFLATFIGRKMWGFLERRIERLPLVSFIYPSVRQITRFLFGSEETGTRYKGVVAVEYPRKGVYSIGFITGEGFEEIEKKLKTNFVTVFVPSSPTPMTGYVLTVPKEEIIELPFKVEQVFRYLISGGVVAPHHEIEEGIPLDDIVARKLGGEKPSVEQKNDQKGDSEKGA